MVVAVSLMILAHPFVRMMPSLILFPFITGKFRKRADWVGSPTKSIAPTTTPPGRFLLVRRSRSFFLSMVVSMVKGLAPALTAVILAALDDGAEWWARRRRLVCVDVKAINPKAMQVHNRVDGNA